VRSARAIRQTAIALFVAIFVSNAYFVQGTGMNQNSRFDLVRAIVEQHALSIDTYESNTIDKSTMNGHYYSDKAPGLSFVSVPAYALVHALGWPSPDRPPDVLHVVTVLVIGVTSSAAAIILFLVLVSMGVRRLLAALGTVAWTLGTNAFGYATLFLAHQFVGALLIASFGLLHAAKDPRYAAHRRWLVPVAGAVGSLAAISEYPAAVAGVMLFAYGAYALGPRRMIPFAGAALAPVAVLMAYNASCFGGPFSLSYAHFAAPEVKEVFDQGLFGLGLPKLYPLGQILFGEARGLLPLSPFLVLAVPGAVVMARDPKRKGEAWLAIGVVLYFLLLNASLSSRSPGWHAGVSMGPRFVVPMLPFAVMLAAVGFEAAARLRAPYGTPAVAACVLLVAVSVATCTMAVTVMPEFLDQRTVRSPDPSIPLPDMRHPLTAFVFPLFVRGYVSVKGVTSTGQLGLAYTAPHHEWDAFNLGEALGLPGLSSLLPLLLVWATAALACARARECAG
jgi:hypothetical protein